MKQITYCALLMAFSIAIGGYAWVTISFLATLDAVVAVGIKKKIKSWEKTIGIFQDCIINQVFGCVVGAMLYYIVKEIANQPNYFLQQLLAL